VAQLSGAGSITFSMYPAVRVLDIEVPAFSRNRQASLYVVLMVFVLVSVSFICICACVGLLYRSSICACSLRLSFLCFGSRKWCSEYKKLWPSTSIVCGRCSLFRDYRTDVGYYVQTVHRLGCFFFYSLTLLIMLAY